jgi:putative flippase GtrA
MSIGDIEVGTSPPLARDPLRAWAECLPRPLRFLGVGGIGLVCDVGMFSLLMELAPRPLLMRLFSLALATLVTWRLNRALTFEPTGRRQGDEALRYATVTLMAQGTSYGVFAALVLTVLAAMPQAALFIGATVAAFVSYNGHRLFAFAPAISRQAPR